MNVIKQAQSSSSKINPVNLWLFTVLIGLFVLVGFSITNSSVSNLNYSGSSSQADVLLGAPNPIRSDEYLRWSPQFIADTKFGNSVSLLDYQKSTEFLSTKESIASQVLDLTKIDLQFKKLVEHVLPIEMAFAFDWWFYVALAMFFIPLYLNLFSVPLSFGIPTALLIFFSPSNQWWSNGQIQILGLAVPGFYFLIKSFQALESKQRLTKSISFQSVISTLLLAQLPFQYQPWSIPITLFLGVMSITFLYFSAREKKSFLKKFVAYSIATLTLVLTRIFVEQDSFKVLADTVYPGQRRIEIQSTDYSLFSTVLTSQLQKYGPSLKFGNPSEAAISFFEISILMILLLPIFALLRQRGIQAKVLISTSGLTLVFTLWIYGIWSESLRFGNLLTFVSQDRLAQVIGNLTLLLLPIFVSLLSSVSVKSRLPINGYLLLVVFAIILLIVFDVRNSESVFRIQPYEFTDIYISITLFIGTLLILLFIPKAAQIIFWTTAILFAILAQFINPIQQGTGDLLNSQLAQEIQQVESTTSGTWASNDRVLDAVLIANTSQLISGQQLNGPNLESWKLFDPTSSQKEVWNRASSFVYMNWTSEEKAVIENPANDVIQISINPCNSTLDNFNLKWILSKSELNFECLSPFKTVTTDDDNNFFIYERK